VGLCLEGQGGGGVLMGEVPLHGSGGEELHTTIQKSALGTSCLRTRHTLEPLVWHWSHWPGRLVSRGGGAHQYRPRPSEHVPCEAHLAS